MMMPSETASSSMLTRPISEESRPFATPTSQQCDSGSTTLWSGQETISSGNHDTQPDLSSSLLWPDSESLFLSLTDGVLWDHSMPGIISLDQISQGVSQSAVAPSIAVDLSPYDEPTVTEDGRRAVQTTNGLLTNTVREV
jgi:hypothetical protein